jgi:hypothetical protein
LEVRNNPMGTGPLNKPINCHPKALNTNCYSVVASTKMDLLDNFKGHIVHIELNQQALEGAPYVARLVDYDTRSMSLGWYARKGPGCEPLTVGLVVNRETGRYNPASVSYGLLLNRDAAATVRTLLDMSHFLFPSDADIETYARGDATYVSDDIAQYLERRTSGEFADDTWILLQGGEVAGKAGVHNIGELLLTKWAKSKTTVIYHSSK